MIKQLVTLDMSYIKRYFVVFLLCFCLIAISVLNSCLFMPKERNSLKLGVDLINALYNVNNPLSFKDTHNEILKPFVNDEILNKISVQINGNRLFYTYYGMENKKLKPIIKDATNSYIEFTLEVNGIEDDTLRAIWFKTENNKIVEFSEAILLPFPE